MMYFNFSVVPVMGAQVCQQMVYIESSILSIATIADPECPYESPVAPPPQGAGMNVEKAGDPAHG
jgi:hypothetical protein